MSAAMGTEGAAGTTIEACLARQPVESSRIIPIGAEQTRRTDVIRKADCIRKNDTRSGRGSRIHFAVNSWIHANDSGRRDVIASVY
jgi:hypothetical protein